MKKCFLFGVALVCATLFFTGCKSKKIVADTVKKSFAKKEVDEMNECEILQERSPYNRAVGVGYSNNPASAKREAEFTARATLARQMKVHAKGGAGADSKRYEQHSGSQREGGGVHDLDASFEEELMESVDEVLANTATIKSVRYRQANGLYEVWVCVEKAGTPGELADEIIDGVKKRISDEEKLKMEFEFKQFRDRLKEEFEKDGQK